MLDLAVDPKLAWALAHRSAFPVDVNTAEREMLLRVPGLGVKAVDRIVAARRQRQLALEDIARVTRSVAKCRPFIIARDWRPVKLSDEEDLRSRVAPRVEQMELFA